MKTLSFPCLLLGLVLFTVDRQALADRNHDCTGTRQCTDNQDGGTCWYSVQNSPIPACKLEAYTAPCANTTWGYYCYGYDTVDGKECFRAQVACK